MTDGYRAMHESAGRIDLSSRGRIRVTGDDRVRLIHAMTTNHVQNLTPGTGCYAFFLNDKGRVLADANILCFEDHLLLDTEPESLAFLMEHLDRYIIADDVVLENITPATSAIGVEGPGAEDSVRTAGLPIPAAPLAHMAAGELTIVRASSTGGPGFRIIGPTGVEPALGALPVVSDEDARVVRLENYFPRFGEDITAANLPQETGLTDALHFSKGCYLGQEIVERVRSRGHVNRTLVGLILDGEKPLPRGAKVTFDGGEAGEVTSSAYSPARSAVLAMAYVRMVAAKPGTLVSVEGRHAQTVAIKSSRT
jgi:aminomethyltransferase